MSKTRKCSKCKQILPLTAFHRNKTQPDGRGYHCKKCKVKYTKKYRETPNGKAARQREYKKYKESANYKTVRLGAELKHRFGITLEQYDQMLATQEGKCAICGRLETHTCNGVITRLAVDHDHVTGKVRQLLCHNCNAAIGYAEDSPQLLAKMIAYLCKHKS